MTLTCDFDRLVIPSVSTSLSIRGSTPQQIAGGTTVVRASSARLRRSSSQSGKYEPWRSFGIARFRLPVRVSNWRCR